jgi:2-polyprenyl-6-methoxyphenol hydroxylase-like FAD-dependent oxidoreductase
VRIDFRTEIHDIESLRNECDLLVAADGVNSTVRSKYAEQLQPSLDMRANRYIWYGTNQLFHGLTLTFRENEAGVFAAHSYKFNQTTSTFIVECDQQTWEKAGFAEMSGPHTQGYVGEVFAKDLDGHPLLSNNSKWINFLLVKNSNWFFENVILLGDALHTAHFSIGSGTKLAMEDSIALAGSFKQTTNVGDALTENARAYMKLSPMELAYTLMTRSGRVSYEDLKRRDPEFIRLYEAADLRG